MGSKAHSGRCQETNNQRLTFLIFPGKASFISVTRSFDRVLHGQNSILGLIIKPYEGGLWKKFGENGPIILGSDYWITKTFQLVGGWTNPSEKYARQIEFHFPKAWGDNKQYLKPPSQNLQSSDSQSLWSYPKRTAHLKASQATPNNWFQKARTWLQTDV